MTVGFISWIGSCSHKVRLQMNANPEQVGALTEMSRLVADEGMRALWKGVGPAMARATALTASQLATYDETKRVMTRWMQLEEGPYLHLMHSEHSCNCTYGHD